MNYYYPPLFKKALFICGIAGLLLILISIGIGKKAFFLYLNQDLGPSADCIFSNLTYLGDGIVWVPIVLFISYVNPKKLPLLLSTILISTLLVQICKQIILPGMLRPFAAIANTQLIHTVHNVVVHTSNSFPSGHTTSVFCFFLLGCLMIKKSGYLIIGFIIALLTGYSRVYLAQHFPLDIGAGMIAAVFSVYWALLIQIKFETVWFTKQ